MSAAHILVVDDEPDIRSLLKEILEDEDFEVSVAEDAEHARRARLARRPDLVLLDIWMPGTDGLALLKEWSDGSRLEVPVIMMSGHGNVETAVEATRLGAYDFIEKPLSIAKLLITIQRALENASLQREAIGLRRQIAPSSEPIGDSAEMEALRSQARKIAEHKTAVFITGESGSGKEIIARYLHKHSPRAKGPFVIAGVAGMARENPDEGLFGSEHDGKVNFGALEQANGGTLFVKDIADLDLNTQARLLSALENQSFLRVGGRNPVSIDVRIMVATRHDLAERVRAGQFRDDLFYFLNVVPLNVPALHERSDDIDALLTYYLDYFVEAEGLPRREFAPSARHRLRDYAWPGNVREIKNLVQRLLILGRGDTVDASEINATLGIHPQAMGEDVQPGFDLPLREAREKFEKAYLEFQLHALGGSVSKVADRVGIERTHLYRKLRSLDIDPKRIKEATKE